MTRARKNSEPSLVQTHDFRVEAEIRLGRLKTTGQRQFSDPRILKIDYLKSALFLTKVLFSLSAGVLTELSETTLMSSDPGSLEEEASVSE